jgi:hypothetical protein
VTGARNVFVGRRSPYGWLVSSNPKLPCFDLKRWSPLSRHLLAPRRLRALMVTAVCSAIRAHTNHHLL